MKGLYLSMFLLSGLSCAESYDKVDLIIFSYDRPLQLYALLESVERYVSHLGLVHVIVRSSAAGYKQAYDEVFKEFPWAVVREQCGPHDFKGIALQSLFDLPNEYIMFAVDDIIIKDVIDMDLCVRAMQRFDAYGFYLRVGKNCTLGYPNAYHAPLPPFVFDAEGLCVWRFNAGAYYWAYPHTVDMTVYKKSDILSDLQNLVYYAPNTLEAYWAGTAGNIFHRLGVCFELSCMVNIPMNRVQNEMPNYSMGIPVVELLDVFNQGKKIDIEQFYKIDNKCAHMNAVPVFISR